MIAGGPDYYPGGGQASPSFSFRATHVRLAGEGDLLARLEALRKQLRAEGLFELQKQLARPLLPKTIGVVTAETRRRPPRPAGRPASAAAGAGPSSGPSRRSRTAARRRRSRAAIQDLAARPEVEAIVVTRGGGSLADLWAFCDETLCRTVAMLRVPVISAVGHERDSTLIDDVAAVACSTPTHAAEAAVPLDCRAARRDLERCAPRRCGAAAEGAVGARARHLAALARGPGAGAAARARSRSTRRSARSAPPPNAASPSAAPSSGGSRPSLRACDAGARGRGAPGRRHSERRREALRRARGRALRAHDPERTLERGYALAESADGEPVTSADGRTRRRSGLDCGSPMAASERRSREIEREA